MVSFEAEASLVVTELVFSHPSPCWGFHLLSVRRTQAPGKRVQPVVSYQNLCPGLQNEPR